MLNVKRPASMNVLVLFKQIVGSISNTDIFFSEICCCKYGKKINYIMREIPEQEIEPYGEKDQIILCLI